MSNKKPNPKTAPSGFSKEAIEAAKRELLFGDTSGSSRRDTRFQKGQSGNPRGRPPRRTLEPAELAALPSIQVVLKEGDRLISVREGASSRSITVREALTRKQIQDGLNGSAYAQEKALQRQEQADRIKALHVAADQALWQCYCDDARRQFAEAKEAGQPEPLVLPHPDDIIFVPGELVRVRAPINEEQLATMRDTRSLCELLILQDAWDERSKPSRVYTERPAKSCTAMIFCVMLNDWLPKRLRLTELEILIKTDRAMGMPKRKLLTELYKGWRARGSKTRRGFTLPPFEAIKPELELRLAAMKAVLNGELDAAALARGEFNDAARAFFEERGVEIG